MTSKRERGAGRSQRRSEPLLGALIVAIALALAGCGAQALGLAEEAQARSAGDPDAPPTLAALPELPPGASGSTERTYQGMLVARQTLDTALPAPPSDRSFAALQQWADTQVADWVAKRREQMETTRVRLLDEGQPSPGELIVSHAVLALLQEDTARTLASIPTPKELDSEQEFAAMYRELMNEQAETFSTAAVLELRECANLAYRGPEDMRAFASYCHARFDRLRGEAVQRDGKDAPPASATARAQ